jgi:DNA primase
MIASDLSLYQRIFGNNHSAKFKAVDRTSLPAPRKYLADRGLLKRKPKSEWATITCPVHADGKEKNPSMRVSLIDGHFRCLACGESGGDVIALHRLITGASFREAVVELGARFA